MLLSLREARSCTGDSLAIPGTRQEVAVPAHVQGGDTESSHMWWRCWHFGLNHLTRSLSFSLASHTTFAPSATGSGSPLKEDATGCIQGGRCRQRSWRVLRKVTGQALGVPKDNHCRVLSDAPEHPTLWLMCFFFCSLWTVSMEVRCYWAVPSSFPLAVLWDAT